MLPARGLLFCQPHKLQKLPHLFQRTAFLTFHARFASGSGPFYRRPVFDQDFHFAAQYIGDAQQQLQVHAAVIMFQIAQMGLADTDPPGQLLLAELTGGTQETDIAADERQTFFVVHLFTTIPQR